MITTSLLKIRAKMGQFQLTMCVYGVEWFKKVRGAQLRKDNIKTNWKGKGHAEEDGSGN